MIERFVTLICTTTSADRTNCDEDDERQSVDHTKEVSPQAYVRREMSRCDEIETLKDTKNETR